MKRNYQGEQKPMGPFTETSQMYITASASDKNKGRWYYGYDGSWLKWVPQDKLGGYMTSLTTLDGKKWLFPPGHIDPEVGDKLALTHSTYNPGVPPYQPPPQVPPPSVPQLVPQPAPVSPPSALTPEQITSIVVKVVSELLPSSEVKDWKAALNTLSDHLSDIGEGLQAVKKEMTDFNLNYRLMCNLKRQKINQEDLIHPTPQVFTSDEPPSDEENQ